MQANGLRSIRVFQIVLLPTLLLLSSCSSLKKKDTKAEAQQHWNEVRGGIKYRLASQQYDGGMFDDCIATTKEVLSLDPANSSAYALLTRAQLERSRPASAQQTLNAARQAGLDSPDLDYLQGVLLEQSDRMDEALAQYENALRKNPSQGDAFLATVECLVALDRPHDALRVILEHGERFDDEATLAVLEARVHDMLGDTNRATDLLAGAVVSTQGDPSVAQELAQLLIRQKRCSEAIALMGPLLEHRIAKDGIQSSLLLGFAACHLSLDDPVAVRRLLEDYAASHRDDALAHLLLAKAALALGDIRAAKSAATVAYDCEPNDSEIQFVRAIVDWKQGEYDSAEQIAARLIGRNPSDADVHCLMGEILLAKKNSSVARSHFAQALEIDPASEWALRGEAICKNDSRSDPGVTP
ncbi:MAG: tetratricopeptide repeat protein [Planctomycetota bacterium]